MSSHASPCDDFLFHALTALELDPRVREAVKLGVVNVLRYLLSH